MWIITNILVNINNLINVDNNKYFINILVNKNNIKHFSKYE
jgi:hypothetical protein